MGLKINNNAYQEMISNLFILSFPFPKPFSMGEQKHKVGVPHKRSGSLKEGTTSVTKSKTNASIKEGTSATESKKHPVPENPVANWRSCHYKDLPSWLQDNEHLHNGHRPPLPSVSICMKSIFRIHTETANIWTHLLGCLAFLCVTLYFISSPGIHLQEKLVFTVFFCGAISCLFLSSAYHTISCHSESVGILFGKLDYTGIALLIMSSFVPWLYYAFYCENHLRIAYMSVTLLLGVTSIIVSLSNRFGQPRYRPLRAGLFSVFGLSGVIPSIHYVLTFGWTHGTAFGLLILMAALYLLGGLIYALRVPERWYPGKFDIWFHSHQFLHVLVVAAAFVNYYGISEIATHRLAEGTCSRNR